MRLQPARARPRRSYASAPKSFRFGPSSLHVRRSPLRSRGWATTSTGIFAFAPNAPYGAERHWDSNSSSFRPAYIYRTPVEISLVENGSIRLLSADRALFDFGPQHGKVPLQAPLSFSGFRIHAPLNRPNYYDELLTFQGSSYFRGLGRNHSYGLSARALALNTDGPEPEEFPLFRSFWIERPQDQSSITVYALLDSASVTGAYTFVIAPGAQTAMHVDAHLFPRRDLSNVGVAPLTSMFWKDTHDSDGPLGLPAGDPRLGRVRGVERSR